MPAAYAQEATSVSTPAIRALKDSMKDPLRRAQALFRRRQHRRDEQGHARRPRRGRPQPPGQGGPAERWSSDENGDRTKLYAEVAKALNIEASQIEKIQEIFAAEWAKSAVAGWWVQGEDGTWAKK
ncbi:MAG: YdbL family protein [Candidatus Moduliflexus flocculans]|nr:YdbL family protein [Candidatus Moduliflexus flocculans]